MKTACARMTWRLFDAVSGDTTAPGAMGLGSAGLDAASPWKTRSNIPNASCMRIRASSRLPYGSGVGGAVA